MPHAPGPGAGFHRDRLVAAERFIAAGRLGEAAALIETALKERPGASDTLNAYGALCLARRDFVRAAEILGAAATADPHHPGLVANLGIAHQALGAHDEARLCLRRAVALAPHSRCRCIPWRWPASSRAISMNRGRPRPVSALDPDSAAPDGLFGSIALAQGDWLEAMPHFEQALRRGSDEAGVLRGLSICCLRSGDIPRALALAERARIESPLDLDTREHLARCQGEAGLWAEAEATCRDVLAYAPDHLGLRVLHARARMALGQPEGALADLTRFTRAHAGSTEALVALAAVARQTGQLAQAQPSSARRCGVSRAGPMPSPSTRRSPSPWAGPCHPWGAKFRPARASPCPGHDGGGIRVAGRFLLPWPMAGAACGSARPTGSCPGAPLTVPIEGGAPLPQEATIALPLLLRGPAEGAPIPYLVPDPALTAIWRRALSEHPRPWIGVLWDGEAPGLPMERIGRRCRAGRAPSA